MIAMPQTRTDEGKRNGAGLAALALGTAISAAILMHWLFGEIRPHFHDAVLGVAFFAGLGIAFPERLESYAKVLVQVMSAWRGK